VTAGAGATLRPLPCPAGWPHPSGPGQDMGPWQRSCRHWRSMRCSPPSSSSCRRTLAAAARIGCVQGRLQGALLIWQCGGLSSGWPTDRGGALHSTPGHPPLRQSSEGALCCCEGARRRGRCCCCGGAAWAAQAASASRARLAEAQLRPPAAGEGRRRCAGGHWRGVSSNRILRRVSREWPETETGAPRCIIRPRSAGRGRCATGSCMN